MNIDLEDERIVEVRFHEVDTLDIVWHGHYVKYFELGRESFGAKHGLDYLSMRERGLKLPVVELQAEFKRPLTYGDRMTITTRYIHTEAAKLKFEYEIKHTDKGYVVASGYSVQVFVDASTDEMLLYYPDFMKSWFLNVKMEDSR